MKTERPNPQSIEELVDLLVKLYDQPFGSKGRGRFRVSMKLMGDLLGQRRVWPDELRAIERSLYQRGYVAIDMESFLVVLSQKTFSNYRRVNEAAVRNADDTGPRVFNAVDPEHRPA